MGTPGCRLGAGAGGRPPETREHQSEAGDEPSRAWRRPSQKQETTLPEPQSEAGEDPLPPQSLETPQSETGKDPTPRPWRRLSQKQERTLPEPGDASVRSTTPHHPEPRGASVRSRGGDPQGQPRLEGPQVPGGGYRQGACLPWPPPVSGTPYSSSLRPGIWICGLGGPASQA